eukprot:COSAG01_NODE_485_length_16397_cov_48.193827_11_plen_72_part_00
MHSDSIMIKQGLRDVLRVQARRHQEATLADPPISVAACSVKCLRLWPGDHPPGPSLKQWLLLKHVCSDPGP